MYILRSKKDGSLYVGHTNDLGRRLAQHNDPLGKSYTAKHGPWELAHSEEHPDRATVVNRKCCLKIKMPARKPCEDAFAFRILLKK